MKKNCESVTSRLQVNPKVRSLVSIAKITQPKNSGAFPRGRLFRQLDDCLDKPVTWVSAPAGSGKTTLVAGYLYNREIPCIWYRVDEGDEDIATFFYYMGLAANKAAPHRQKPLPLLTPEYLPGIATFTLRYFENLYSRLEPPFVIVFDDYQHVSGQSKLHEIICKGLNILPERVHAVLISRELPPPQFVRLCVSGAVSFLESADVRFSIEESRRMVRMKGLHDLPDAIIRQLHEKSHGWAAGMVLLTESAKRKDVGYNSLASLTPREIFDYFASEIFDKTDPEIRKFLLKSAFLPGMTSSAAGKITGVSRPGDILSRLHRGYFFTEKNAESDPVYTYHPLFREFLLARAKETFSVDELSAIRRKAAELLMSSGHMEDAVSLLHDAEDWNGLIRVILDNAQLLLSEGRNKTLEEWIGYIPAALTEGMPWLLFWKGICKSPGDQVESRANLERAFDIFVSRGDDAGALTAWSGVVSTILLGFDSRKLLDKWIAWLDYRVGRGVPFPSPEIEASVANGMAAALVWRVPNHPDIGKWLAGALSQLQKTQNGNYLYSNLCIAIYNMFMGKAAECVISVNEMKKIKSDSPFVGIMLKMAEATAYCSSIDTVHEAIRSLAEGRELARQSGVHTLAPAYFWMGMSCSMISGNMDMARELLSEYKDSENLPHMHACHVSFFTAWYNLAAGNTDLAVYHAKRAAQLIEMLGEPIYEAYARFLLAYLQYETGDPAEALRELALARDITSRTGSPLCEYVYHMTDAYMAFEGGNDDKGLASLRLAMTLGRQCGYSALACFWRPEILGRICVKALEAGIEVEYAHNLVRKFGLSPKNLSVEIENWPWPVKIHTLGRFELHLDGEPVRFPRKVQRKPLLLLKALVAFGDEGLKSEKLMDILWPEADGDKALSAMTSTLSRLRRLIGIDRAVETHERIVSLNPQYCRVDAWALDETLDRMEAGLKGTADRTDGVIDEAIARAEKALAMYRGPFLPEEENAQWAAPLRERLRKRICRLVVRVGSRLESEGLWERAAEWYQKALAADDFTDEELYRRLMICHQRLDQPAMAIEVYKRCRKTLVMVLGIKPSAKTEAILNNLGK